LLRLSTTLQEPSGTEKLAGLLKLFDII
jgi:hypothetical protein